MHPDNAEAVDDLVERLRAPSGMRAIDALANEAADAIEQKDKLIAELRGALAERQAAIDELVAVKELREQMRRGEGGFKLIHDYDRRDQPAWQRARTLASPATKDPRIQALDDMAADAQALGLDYEPTPPTGESKP